MKKKSPRNERLKQKHDEYIKSITQEIEDLAFSNSINSYIGNKGYTIYKDGLNTRILDFIRKELMVKPIVQTSLVDVKPYPIYQESEKKIYVPRFWGIKHFGYPKSIKISKGETINLKFDGSMRDYQEDVKKLFLEATNFQEKDNNKGDGSALIELWTGAGKTVLALNILATINKKTIIFVHKTFLKNQWIERIQQFLPNARIGTIQGQVIDIENKDIVIAMIQSISMKSYPESMFESFGLSIYDECHHISSEVFSNCLKKCTTLYSLGLSATMERKDGLTKVFKMYLGNICNENMIKNNKNKDDVLVKAIDYKVIDDDEFNEIEYDYRGNIKYSTMISKLSKYNYRNDFIINVIENELKINNKQQIILLAHNRNMLNYIYKSINEKNIASIGYYVGGMKENDLKLSESKQVILATYQMAAEGLDIKSLTTLILATPKSDIVQAVGRILREKHSKPLIIDIIDSHDPFLNQFNKRRSFYNEKSYKIIRTNNEKYIDYIKEINEIKKNNLNSNDNDTNINNTNYNLDIDIKLLDKYWKEMIYRPRGKKNKPSNNKATNITKNLMQINLNTELYDENNINNDLIINNNYYDESIGKCLINLS